MNFGILIKQSFSSIGANKLRSLLSILGIVIGISSVVVMLAVGEGAKTEILKSFDNIDNLIAIEQSYNYGPGPGENEKGGLQTTTATPPKKVITKEIAEILPKKIFGIEQVIFTYSNRISCQYSGVDCNGSIRGISYNYLSTKDYQIKDGSYFSKMNYENNDKVIILGYNFVNEIFGTENPLGKKITLGGSNFIVQGILKKQEKWEVDNGIFLPYSTTTKVFGGGDLEKIEVFTNKTIDIHQIKKDLQYFLMMKSGAQDPSQAPFRITTNEDALKQVNEIVGQMRLLLGIIGSIALIVGGIGIMNIMLVSVTERTREIGIRKAIGATNTNILFQFLIESIVLSMIGCVIAIGFSYGVVYFVGEFFPEFTPIITNSVMLLSSGVAISMGIIFGILPAWKAARLKPIDALRFE